jgi:hypothetical protein
LVDILILFSYPPCRPGRPGAAKPFELRQDRKIATVRKCLWVPPVSCPDILEGNLTGLNRPVRFLIPVAK